MAGAAVEQGRRGSHVVEGRQQVVELYGTAVGIVFTQRQAHGDAHEKYLRQFQTIIFPVQEVAVVQGLQAEEPKLQVAFGFQGSAQAFHVESRHGFVEQFVTNAGADEGAQGLRVHLGQGQAGVQIQRGNAFKAQLFQKQAGGDGAVVRLAFDAAPGGHDECRQHFGFVDAVVQVANGFLYQGVTVDAVQPDCCIVDLLFHQAQVQRYGAAVGLFYGKSGVSFNRLVQSAFAGVFLTVKYVSTGHFLLFGAHQGQLYLVLNVFDVDPATGFQAAANSLYHLLGYPVNGVVDAGRTCCLVTFNSEEGFGNGYADFGGGKTDQVAVAFDNLKGFGAGWR